MAPAPLSPPNPLAALSVMLAALVLLGNRYLSLIAEEKKRGLRLRGTSRYDVIYWLEQLVFFLAEVSILTAMCTVLLDADWHFGGWAVFVAACVYFGSVFVLQKKLRQRGIRRMRKAIAFRDLHTSGLTADVQYHLGKCATYVCEDNYAQAAYYARRATQEWAKFHGWLEQARPIEDLLVAKNGHVFDSEIMQLRTCLLKVADVSSITRIWNVRTGLTEDEGKVAHQLVCVVWRLLVGSEALA